MRRRCLVIDHNYVVQALASDATDHAFHVTILPWAFRGDRYLFYAYSFNS